MILLGLMAAISPLSGVSLTTDNRQVIEVRSDDLDLTVEADARRLARRVAVATHRVCDIDERSINAARWRAACRVEVRQRAAVRIAQVVAAAKLPRQTQLSSR
jgi:UrcA family protein